MERSVHPRAQRGFLIQVMFANAFTLLTGGVFLVGLALYMGASDTAVGLLNVMPNICGILTIFFVGILERFPSRKKLTIGLTLLAKLPICFAVLIPLFVPEPARLFCFGAAVVLSLALQALCTVSLNNWLLYAVPPETRGKYIAKRQTFSILVSILLPLAAGRFMDSMSDQYVAFLVLFSMAMLMAVMETSVLSRIDDVAVVSERHTKVKLRGFLSDLWKNKPYLRYVAYVSLFYLTLYIGDSFMSLYLMKYLQLPYTTIVLMQMLMTGPQLFLLRFWGKISDRRGHSFALTASIWFFIGETLFLALSGTANYFICVPIAFLASSVANSGFMVAVFNRRYEVIPQQNRMMYDGVFSAATGAAFILGPLIGGGLKTVFAGNAALMQNLEFGDIRMLFLISAAGIALIQAVMLFAKKRTGRHQPAPCPPCGEACGQDSR